MKIENKRKTIKIGGFLVVIFFVIYIPSFLIWAYGNNLQTEIIMNGTIEDSINTDAYFVRDEEVIKSPFEGNCIINVQEGEKVPANFAIATVIKDSSQKLYDQIKLKEIEILKAQKEKSKNSEFFSKDILKIDEQIEEKLKKIITDGQGDIKKEKLEIDELVRKKASIYGLNSVSDTYIETLKKDRDNLQQQIITNTKDIYSVSAGVISYIIDGYEAVLKPESIKNLSPEFINEINSKIEKKDINNLKVEVEKPFSKVIKGIDGYIIIALDNRELEGYKLNDNVKLRINDIGKIVDGTVYFKSKEVSGKSFIAVKLDKWISETARFRKINVDLIKTYYSGLKVPLSCLRDQDSENMKANIVLAKGNSASIKRVEILGKNSEYAIIDNVKEDQVTDGIGLYDAFILKPENIEEGQIINR